MFRLASMNFIGLSFYFSFFLLATSAVLPRKLLGGKIITTKLNKTVGYWTDDVLRQALANPLELDFGEAVQVNISRHKREGHVWTDDEIRSSSAVEAELSLEALRELGIEPNENALFDVEVSPKHIADIGQYPFNNYGKLFLTTPTGGAAHCSAAFIRERVLFTAAHCVRNRNGDWYQDFRFHQRFNGMEDQGRIVEVNKPFIYGNYINEQGTMELRLDYAFLTTTESDDVSPLGYDFSGEVSTEEQIYFAGYPADTEGGSKLIWSSGTRSPDVNALIHVPQNPLTQGSSGGAWLTLDSEGIYKIVGVASHGKPARGIPGAFSPLLSSDTAELLSSAESAVLSESAEHTVSIDEDETLIARSSNTQGCSGE